MKKNVTHNIIIAAECPPTFDVSDITTRVVNSLTPTGVYPRNVSVTENDPMGFRDAVVVSTIMGIFGFGLAVGTYQIAGMIGTGIMSIARRRQVKPAYHVYPEKEQS